MSVLHRAVPKRVWRSGALTHVFGGYGGYAAVVVVVVVLWMGTRPPHTGEDAPRWGGKVKGQSPPLQDGVGQVVQGQRQHQVVEDESLDALPCVGGTDVRILQQGTGAWVHTHTRGGRCMHTHQGAAIRQQWHTHARAGAESLGLTRQTRQIHCLAHIQTAQHTETGRHTDTDTTCWILYLVRNAGWK